MRVTHSYIVEFKGKPAIIHVADQRFYLAYTRELLIESEFIFMEIYQKDLNDYFSNYQIKALP